MILSLNNIAKIESAVVEINGITVIAGENNTGKSTVGKVLFSVFNCFYNIEAQIRRERIENIEIYMSRTYHMFTERTISRIDYREIAQIIVDNTSKYRENPGLIQEDVFDFINQTNPNFDKHHQNGDWKETFKRIEEVLKVSDDEFFRVVLSKKLQSEFNEQINNIYLDNSGEISLKIKDETVTIRIEENYADSITNRLRLNTEVLYIDDPFVIDENRYPVFSRYGIRGSHREHLITKLFYVDEEPSVINQILAKRKLDEIYAKINSICGGEIVRLKSRGLGYKRLNSEKVLDIKNISTGLKTFVIIKRLLQNGNLEENGTIVLDEPEIHLHPEWQILFAELIVLIQKEFNMHILLNTHSPYFLNAIEVYAAKYKVAEKCKYYMASLYEDVSRIEDVTGNVDAIYQRLARPLQELENERWNDDD